MGSFILPMLSKKVTTSIATSITAAQSSLRRLLAWLETSPEVTRDPTDFKAHPWFVRRITTRHKRWTRLTLKTAYAAFALAPETMRTVLGIPRVQTAGAAAWQAQGFLKVFGLTRETKYLTTAERWMARLEGLKVSNRHDCLWGFPFDWQSVILIPANTPLLYTSWQAAQTYFEHYQITESQESISHALAICQSMLGTLNRLVDTPEELCLSYSPYDSMQVYNVNASMGGLLSQLGRETGNRELLNDGARLLNWVARGQQKDGRWVYFSKKFGPLPNSVDHFHTAMTLQGLLSGYLVAPEHEQWKEVLERGIKFYLNHLFDSKQRPRFSDSQSYPTDVMSCAEGILFLDQLCKARPNGLVSSPIEVQNALSGLVTWTTGDFQEKCGSFYFQGHPGYKIRLRSYRWGQGAMLKALASFLQQPD
jgi:polysaccharide biosynthesis protein VpsJ